MALTSAQLIDELAQVAGTGARAGDSYRTSLLRYLNQAFRSIAYAYPWDAMRSRQTISTVAPYTTGTIAVTQGGTTITGTGTTWTTEMTGRKFALTQGGPFYRVTFVDSTHLTISAYAEATQTSATYVIFQDEYDLAATTHAVEDVQLVGDLYGGTVRPATQRDLDHADFLGLRTGRPCVWAQTTDTTVNTPRIRLLPVPDTIYRVEFRYQKTWTALADGSDLYTTQGLPEDIEELALDRALRWLPRIEGSRRVMSDSEWKKALADVWAQYGRTKTRMGTRAGIGSGYAGYGVVLNLSGMVTS